MLDWFCKEYAIKLIANRLLFDSIKGNECVEAQGNCTGYNPWGLTPEGKKKKKKKIILMIDDFGRYCSSVRMATMEDTSDLH